MLKKTKEDYSENDFLRIVWSPILELLFMPYEHGLITKTGETISKYHISRTQEHKQDLYFDSLDVVAFKIDAKIILKNNGKDVDIVSDELAKNDIDK